MRRTCTPDVKPCIRCGGTNRYADTVRANGWRQIGACVACTKKRGRAGYAANPDKRRKSIEKWREKKPRHARMVTLLTKARNRAKEKGLPFDLTMDVLLKEAARGTCAFTGIRIDWRRGPRRLSGPSLDRIDPKRGYTDTNTRLVCWGYNSLKGTASDAEVRRFINKIRRNRSVK